LRKILIQATQGAVLKRGSFYRAKYNSLRYKLGSANKAKVAIANRLARSIYKVLGGECYKELGYMRGDPRERQVEKLVKKLRALGVDIQHKNHQLITATRELRVDASGIVLN
jgi:hypothetical protein